MDHNDADGIYDVVVNHEDQYSIWRVGRTIPAGWQATAIRGTQPVCLAYIAEVWTDMRPLSLRRSAQRST
jgi:MbtH protein